MAGCPSDKVAFQGGLTLPFGQVTVLVFQPMENLGLGEPGVQRGPGIRPHWADQRDAEVLCAGGDGRGGGVPGVGIVLDRTEPSILETLMNAPERVDVLFGRRGGGHVHDDVGAVRVAGLALVVAVADLGALACGGEFLAVPGLGIVRRDDLHARPRHAHGVRVRPPVGAGLTGGAPRR